MIPLQSVLALDGFMIRLPMIVAIACAVILVIAFIVGMVQGFRKISWGGFFWAIVAVGFVFANKYLRDVNPVNKLFEGKVNAELTQFFSTLSIAVACVLIGLILYGILAAILRPRKKWVKKENTVYDDYGFEYETDDEIDGDDDKELIKIGYGKPCLFTRLMGGIVAVINMATVLAVVFGFATLIISATNLYNTSIGIAFSVPATQALLKYALIYLLDAVTIGIIFAIAFSGYEQGLFNGVRSLIVYVGGTACVVACFVLPFMKMAADWPIMGTFIARCSDMFAGVSNQMIGGILGKLLCGVLMAAVVIVAFIFLNVGLCKLGDLIKADEGSKVIDGCLAVVVYLAIGVAVVAALWSALYALEYCGLIHASEIFNENAPISNGFYDFGERFIKPFAEKYLIKFK